MDKMKTDAESILARTLDLDSFGEIMGKFLKENPVQMMIEMPEGTITPLIQDNIGLGPVTQLYILINALEPVLAKLAGVDGILDPDKAGDFLDGVLALIKHDVLEGFDDYIDKDEPVL